MVSEEQLKPVKSCWPVSYVEYDAGDYGVTIKAKPDGSFVTNTNLPKTSQERGHIYYHDGIALFWIDRIVMEAGYNPATRELSDYDLITKQTLFPAEQIQGCGPEPTVENALQTKANKPVKSRKS